MTIYVPHPGRARRFSSSTASNELEAALLRASIQHASTSTTAGSTTAAVRALGWGVSGLRIPNCDTQTTACTQRSPAERWEATMSDLTERLRNNAATERKRAHGNQTVGREWDEAAARIEELEAALRKQRQVFGRSPSLTYAAMRMDGIARQALGDEA
jgi:ribulose-5-phosphate 4-epimerase/fuculose-1-phosphate aldolase